MRLSNYLRLLLAKAIPARDKTFADVYPAIKAGAMVRREGWLQFNVMDTRDGKPVMDWSVRFIAISDGSISVVGVSSFNWGSISRDAKLSLQDASATDWIVISWPERKSIEAALAASEHYCNVRITEAMEAANVD